MNKMSDVKRRLITSMIAIVLLIITIVGITYAFFTSQVKGNTNTKSAEAKAGRLQLKYADGNGLIELYKIQPGVILETKTFTVTNTGTGLIENYDVIMENVMNELEHYEDLTYTLTCTSTSGSCVGSYGVFPTQESIIATNTIDVGVKHTYQLTVEYNETNLDQSIDMNKTVFAKVNIQDSNDNDQSSNLIIYGNTIYDQNSTPNNPTSLSSVGEIVKASSLPTGYDELEYIESTGTQYIDTGVYMNYSKKIYVDFKLNTLQSQTRIFGADFDASSGVTGFSTSLYRNGSGIFSYSYQDDTGNWIQTGIKTDLKRHTFLIDGINKIANLDDGVYEGSLASYSATKTATKTLTIFADNRPINSTPINYYASMRLYSFKIWNNGELIRDFVPAKNSSNVVGLYDKIGNNFYVSPNNESFIAGPITYI